jgi:superfamily II DNA or RNA helicase
MQPYLYQSQIINDAIRSTLKHDTILVQAATGAGKTVMFSFIAHRFICKSIQDVIIYVDSEDLVKQTRTTIFNCFGISAQPILAGMRKVPKNRIYIAMINSVGKRMPSNIGLGIVDECHIATLHKAHTFTEKVKIIGFTATPISANKKLPLKDIYQTIVVGPQIRELIKQGKLCQNITLAPKDVVDRNFLSVRGDDFDVKLMGTEFSKAKHVKNTLKYYEKLIKGKKTLIFNCNVAHSIEVCKHFLAAGYNCKHVDADNVSKTEYNQILLWLKNTPDAILCSVGKMTKGFDEPTVEAIIVNRSIMSVSLWLQITGRGARISPNKDIFYILDMGANAVNLGDWCDERDWNDIFYNPPTFKKNAGVAPCKSCPQCDAILAAQARECKWCEFVFPVKVEAPEAEISEEYAVITRGIDIDKFISRAERLGHKPFASFYKIGEKILKNAPDAEPKILIKTFESEAKKWCEAKDIKYNSFHKRLIVEFIEKEIAKLPPPIPNTIQPLKPITNLFPSWL